jgi:hypothetical protein
MCAVLREFLEVHMKACELDIQSWIGWVVAIVGALPHQV